MVESRKAFRGIFRPQDLKEMSAELARDDVAGETRLEREIRALKILHHKEMSRLERSSSREEEISSDHA